MLILKHFRFSGRHIGFLTRAKYGLKVANSYSGKVTKARPLIPSGSEMAAKIVVWG